MTYLCLVFFILFFFYVTYACCFNRAVQTFYIHYTPCMQWLLGLCILALNLVEYLNWPSNGAVLMTQHKCCPKIMPSQKSAFQVKRNEEPVPALWSNGVYVSRVVVSQGKLDALWVLLKKGYDRVSIMRPQPGDKVRTEKKKNWKLSKVKEYVKLSAHYIMVQRKSRHVTCSLMPQPVITALFLTVSQTFLKNRKKAAWT